MVRISIGCALMLQIVVILHQLQPIESSKIFGFFTVASPSVFIIQDSVMRGLAARGHDVTVAGIYPAPADAIPNYRYIYLELSPENNAYIEKMKSKILQNAEENENFFLRLPKTLQGMNKITVDSLQHAKMIKLMSEERFDLVVLGWFFNDYQIGLAAHFQCPAVIISTIPAIKMLRDYVGNPTGISYNPMFHGLKQPMTFMYRVANALAVTAEFIATNAFNYFVLEPIYQQNFPPNKYPSFDEAKKNVSLVLASQHFSQLHPTVNFPGLVEVSGMHINPRPGSLPSDINAWLDSATNGAIYFSLGSNVQSSNLPKEKLEAILRVFSKLKQKILWKWEDDKLPGKPDNVMVKKWLPQDDILAHPNVKVFISHCGRGSITEANYHGVPILGMPIYGDQVQNIEAIVNEGWGVRLDYVGLTEESLSAALTEILTNGSYAQVVEKASLLFRDRPQHPLVTAVYWVEYVLRHNGAKHMQSQAVHLNWFQYHSVDVIGFLLVVVYFSFRIFKCIVKSTFRKCCSGKAKRE